MKYFAVLLFAWVFAFSGAQAHETSGVDDKMELEKVRGAFKDTWVHPNADFTRYNKILPGEGEFEFRDVGPARKYRSTMRTTSSKSEFGIAESEQKKFEEVVSEIFMEELSRSRKFDIVSEPGPGTLLLQGSVLDIVSHVPPEFTGRSEIYLSSVATVTLVIQLFDAQTGQLLAHAEERKKIQQPGGGRIDQFTMPANSVTVWADIKRWARSSASRLRKAMEKAQKG
jgi:hypothetical protein